MFSQKTKRSNRTQAKSIPSGRGRNPRQKGAGSPTQRRRTPKKNVSNRVGIASPARQMMHPMRISSRRQYDGSTCRIKGTDYLTNIYLSGVTFAGTVLYTAVVNPKTLGISRLATMSTLFERYKFKSLKFRYSPIAPTTSSGQLIGYVDYDTYDDPTGLSGIANIQRAAAHFGEKPTQVWEGGEKPVFWEIKDVDPMTDLYIDSDGSDPRWTNQGRFVLLAASTIPATTNCGNIYLDYDIEFYIPQLEQTSVLGHGCAWYGYATSTMSSTTIFGTTPVYREWNDLDFKLAASTNTVTLNAGCYLICYQVIGSAITAAAMTSALGTSVDQRISINTAATEMTGFFQVYCATPFTVVFTITATTVTSSQARIGVMPPNAITLSQRKLDRISRVLNSIGDLKDTIAKAQALTDEGKDLKHVRSESKQEKSAYDSDERFEMVPDNPVPTFATLPPLSRGQSQQVQNRISSGLDVKPVYGR